MFDYHYIKYHKDNFPQIVAYDVIIFKYDICCELRTSALIIFISLWLIMSSNNDDKILTDLAFLFYNEKYFHQLLCC